MDIASTAGTTYEAGEHSQNDHQTVQFYIFPDFDENIVAIIAAENATTQRLISEKYCFYSKDVI